MSSGKKILCFIESLEAGGAQRQLISLASLLKDEGHHPVIVTYYPNSFYADTLSSLGIEHIFLENSFSSFRRLAAFRRVLKSQAPYCVVSFEETASMYLCFLRMFMKFKLIVSERNATLKIGAIERLRFQLYRVADKVVCNSMSKSKFIEDNVPHLSSKTHTIINYLDTERFKPLQLPRQTSSLRRLLVLARVVPQKNVERFIEALRLLKADGCHLSVDWHGQPIEPYHTKCQELISKYQLDDILKINPPISDVEEVYNKYDGFCLPSIYEGFPNVVGEAMSCGVPVLCGDVCDNKFLLGEESNLLFNPYDINDMKDKLELFCNLSNEQLQEKGKNNRKRALKIFSSAIFVKEYLNLMEL